MTHQALLRPAANATDTPAGILQRQCACGNAASNLTGECEECQRDKALGVQTKLTIGASDDPLEHEADRAAAQVMRMGHAEVKGSGSLPTLTRRSNRAQAGHQAEAPASVQRTLQTSGEPLSHAARTFFEPRFGHDFGKVRVHRDAAAVQSARDVKAHAYAVGRHIAFDHGQYAPDSHAGRELIAHELAHVVQQGNAGTQAAHSLPLRRRSIFQEIAGLFAGDDFDEQTLQDYLSRLRRTHQIEDFTDSDNKARAIVKAWHKGDSPYVLTQDLKALLIEEMLSGFTGDDDERAILELLERSYNYELGYLFGSGGITVDALNRAFQGSEQACLSDFFTRRFRGGEGALASGTVEPQGEPTPFGDEVPTQCAYNVRFPGLGVEWSLPCVLGILCSEDRQVVADLTRFDVEAVNRIEVDKWEYQGGNWSITDTRTPSGAADPNATPPEIKLLSARSCAQAARIIVHEVRHQNQPPGSRFQRERDAYIYTEQWAIDRGLPGYGNTLRSTDPQSGAQTVDTSAVEAYVRQRYPGTQGSANETIVGHRSSDDFTEIAPANGPHYFRAPQPGDSHWGTPRFPGARPIPPSDWVCPGPRPATSPSLPAGVIRRDFNDRLRDSVGEL
ncbi:eCIS core domain-containing protein [Litchfieldella rifensis]|uniref:DUF4157 domain-containing protein n=1 Tax=Litchfieldella rifensis TaxID=762643 RepID=A0ABV7LPG0_9GAMM